MFYSNICVFKEIILNNQTFYQWYRTGNEGEDYIVPDIILSEEDHWEMLNAG